MESVSVVQPGRLAVVHVRGIEGYHMLIERVLPILALDLALRSCSLSALQISALNLGQSVSIRI